MVQKSRAKTSSTELASYIRGLEFEVYRCASPQKCVAYAFMNSCMLVAVEIRSRWRGVKLFRRSQQRDGIDLGRRGAKRTPTSCSASVTDEHCACRARAVRGAGAKVEFHLHTRTLKFALTATGSWTR